MKIFSWFHKITQEDLEDGEMALKKMGVNVVVGIFILILLGMGIGFFNGLISKIMFPDKNFVQVANEMEEMFADIQANKQKIKTLEEKTPSKWGLNYGQTGQNVEVSSKGNFQTNETLKGIFKDEEE